MTRMTMDTPPEDEKLEPTSPKDDKAWHAGMTVDEKIEYYAARFEIIVTNSDPSTERRHWQEKVAGRRRMVDAFQKLDEYRRRHNITEW
jgi:hypothetical protein